MPISPEMIIDVAKTIPPPFTRQKLLNECEKKYPYINSENDRVEESIWRLMESGELINDGLGNLTVKDD